jgi:peptidoglycan hydrolase-like protein with peptidoglycan-binding domain
MNIQKVTGTRDVVGPQALSGGGSPNSILQRYQPSGASGRTASQDGLSAGVGASHQMAMNDLPRLKKYEQAFSDAGRKHGVPPALLAAICSRESRGGAILDSRGLGDNGNGFGLMQVDFGSHKPVGGPYSKEHIDQAAGILKSMLNEVKAKHPDWPAEQQLRGAVAAYNSGAGNVRTQAGMDRGTTGNDYSNDVWARAQALAPHFGGASGAAGPTPGSMSGSTTLPPFDGKYTAAPGLEEVAADKALLRIGQQGPEVRELQTLLGLPEDARDGKFGPQTREAVQAFQQKHGLTPPAGKEGMVGATTLEWLRHGGRPPSASKPQPATQGGSDGFATGKEVRWRPAPSLEDVVKNGKVLREGMQGASVQELQKLLGLPQDGKFGQETKKAVASFQQSAGLTMPKGGEGVLGATTLKALRSGGGVGGAANVGDISARGREQMRKLLEYAESHNSGASRGRCFEFVWRYMTSSGSGYGKIQNHNDASDMPSAYARNFAEYMNQGDNAARWGLRKLNITNPYDAPPGAIVVVGPGTPGTSHPTAGDIAIATGKGRFVNDGPNMGYGEPAHFQRDGGKLLGVYVPM